jgi:LmbE family N-acetylglucosaminyl deacetylase
MEASSYADAMRALPLTSIDAILGEGALVVLAPHPDDEALGLGGLIAGARAQHRHTEIVFLTDGSMSHPNSQAFPRLKLIELRKAEAVKAATALGVPAECLTYLGLPDGKLPTAGPLFDATVRFLSTLVARVNAGQLFVTSRHDPHQDHAAAAWLASTLARNRSGLRILEYPIWSWHLDRDKLSAPEAPMGAKIDISPWYISKRVAIKAYTSQMTNLINDDPLGFHFSKRELAPFLTNFEYFLEAPYEN